MRGSEGTLVLRVRKTTTIILETKIDHLREKKGTPREEKAHPTQIDIVIRRGIFFILYGTFLNGTGVKNH